MKGFFEEYGTFVVTSIITMSLLGFIIGSSVSPTGSIHRFFVSNMVNVGAQSGTVVEEWDVGTVKVTLKDDGGLYISGSGTLPSYSDVSETPWASQKGNITYVKVDDSVSVNGTVPIK